MEKRTDLTEKDRFITNEIVNVRSAKGLLAFKDKLTAANTNRYAGIHAQGETGADGRKHYSRIGLQMQDYSAGTGIRNIITNYNLSPDFVRYLFAQTATGVKEFEYRQSKIFGDPDENGLCKAQTITITRHTLAHDGTPATNPWRILITNGRGEKARGRNGGTYIKQGSYRKEKETAISLTDVDLYSALSRVDSYIRLWEQAEAPRLIAAGRQLYQNSFGKDVRNDERI